MNAFNVSKIGRVLVEHVSFLITSQGKWEKEPILFNSNFLKKPQLVGWNQFPWALSKWERMAFEAVRWLINVSLMMVLH